MWRVGRYADRSMRTIGQYFCVVLALCFGCGDVERENEDPQCGGCALPPICNVDGTAPSAPCSCGCVEGDQLAGGVCTAAGCLTTNVSACDSAPLVPVTAPTVAKWMARTDGLPALNDGATDPFPLSVNPLVCESGRVSVALGLGSAFAEVVQAAGTGECEVWLGGETESPEYDGTPTQYCRFPNECAPVVADHLGDSGPASIDSPYCVSPGISP
jgi:hypothetical protein